MVARPSRRTAPQARAAAGERARWLSGTATALAVSALGLALAGSIAVTGNAEPPRPGPGSAERPSAVRTAVPSTTPDPSVTAPFIFGGDGGEPLRKVVVTERAAQRAEELAKNAEAVSRAASEASSRVRQQSLSADDRATRAKGQELARQALARAAAARAAAVTARIEAEAAARAAAVQAQREAAEVARAEAEGIARDRADEVARAEAEERSEAPPAPTTAPSPQSEPRQPAASAAPPVTSPGRGGRGVSPVPGAVVGASFGQYGLWSRYHTGLDFRAAYGVPIRAVKSGVVLYAGNSGDWAGIHVAVRHSDGMTTMSSHMSSMTVSAGQTVQAGQVIGYVGQTGRAFGAHLHYELYPAGVKYGDVYRAIDPIPWLRAAGVRTR